MKSEYGCLIQLQEAYFLKHRVMISCLMDASISNKQALGTLTGWIAGPEDAEDKAPLSQSCAGAHGLCGGRSYIYSD